MFEVYCEGAADDCTDLLLSSHTVLETAVADLNFVSKDNSNVFYLKNCATGEIIKSQ
jgi:hypothetical protein